jgi:hypothetical protein
MNKKNKVLLGAIGLVLLSGIAATSSTFAWFTTVRTASISYGDAAVYSRDGNLNVTFKSSLNTVDKNTTAATQALVLTGTNRVTDISGDGLAFHKPVWSTPGSVASSITALTMTGAGAADDYWVDFTVTLSRDNELDDEGFKVYLGNETNIVGKTDGAQQALNDSVVPATRLAVIRGSEVVMRWTPNEELGAKYLAAPGTGAYGTTTHELKNDTQLVHGAFVDYTTQAAAAAGGTKGAVIADLSSGIAKQVDVTFRAWIEGCDTQTENEIIGGVFNVIIDLYALAA